jgi:hypothetical protein
MALAAVIAILALLGLAALPALAGAETSEPTTQAPTKTSEPTTQAPTAAGASRLPAAAAPAAEQKVSESPAASPSETSAPPSEASAPPAVSAPETSEPPVVSPPAETAATKEAIALPETEAPSSTPVPEPAAGRDALAAAEPTETVDAATATVKRAARSLPSTGAEPTVSSLAADRVDRLSEPLRRVSEPAAAAVVGVTEAAREKVAGDATQAILPGGVLGDAALPGVSGDALVSTVVRPLVEALNPVTSLAANLPSPPAPPLGLDLSALLDLSAPLDAAPSLVPGWAPTSATQAPGTEASIGLEAGDRLGAGLAPSPLAAGSRQTYLDLVWTHRPSLAETAGGLAHPVGAHLPMVPGAADLPPGSLAGGDSNPSPGDLPAAPFDAPGAAAGSAGSLFVPLVALLALLALAAPATFRRRMEAPDFLAPIPFVCALERPG